MPTEVDEQTVFESRGFEVPEDLSGVFVKQRFGGFQFYEEILLDQQVCSVVSQVASINVADLETGLSLNTEPFPLQSKKEGAFVDLLQVTGSKIRVNIEARFSDQVAKLKDVHSNTR